MAKKTLLSMTAVALLALTACGGSDSDIAKSETSATATASATTASANPSATASSAAAATAAPTPTVVEETTEAPELTEEPSEEPTEEPSEEPSEEPTPEPSIDPYSQGQTITEDGVTFFLPDGYNQDPSVAQPQVFTRQYTHLNTEDDAAGRLMVGTPFTNDSGKTVEELEKQLVSDLTTAWKIQDTVETQTYYRADGSQVIRTEVRFASTNNPGYIFTINNGAQVMYAGLLVDQGDAIFVDRIEASLGIVPQ